MCKKVKRGRDSKIKTINSKRVLLTIEGYGMGKADVDNGRFVNDAYDCKAEMLPLGCRT